MIDTLDYPWEVLVGGKPTDQRFTNAPCAAHTAVKYHEGAISHPVYGAYDSYAELEKIRRISSQNCIGGQMIMSEEYRKWLHDQQMRPLVP